MKAPGLLSMLLGFVAFAGASEARTGASAASHPVLRPPPHFISRASPRPGIGWNCNRRGSASGSYFAPSWFDYSAHPQQYAPPSEPAPPVINNVFVEPPAAPPYVSDGPRIISVDPGASSGHDDAGPVVIYGDAPGKRVN